MLEKPSDLLDAKDMLEALSGRVHQVMTAVALATPAERCDVRLVTTNVAFRKLDEAEIEAYWRTGEPCDKAGALCYPGHCRQIRQSPRGELQCRGRPAPAGDGPVDQAAPRADPVILSSAVRC